jgi:pyruvate dehydrogenase E2 component (dihydrolipoamide acetyltransferase)
MIREVFMPALSSTMTEGKIVSWVKSPGDKVEKGETVVIVESDKADMDVESFHEGILAAIVVEAGESAPVGEAIALLAETEDEIEAAKQQAAAQASGLPSRTCLPRCCGPRSVAAAPEPICPGRPMEPLQWQSQWPGDCFPPGPQTGERAQN